ATIEDREVESEAYAQSSELFKKHLDLAGMCVTTEASISVLNAACDAQMLDKITFITTDLFPALLPEIRSRAVAATIYQRPRTLGRMAFRVLREFPAEGECPSYQVTLAPHLVMGGNLDFFLQRHSLESSPHRAVRLQSVSPEWVEYFGSIGMTLVAFGFFS
ncbi:MAG TPA: substrate-binding domain-containing protein, partial [Candidatus Acidoferrum sp.]|nr:substrate-binding domain-containing protein [Candidatus Acidoferrum sp.]